MAAILPNPFMTSVARPHDATETAVASLPPPAPDAAATRFVLDPDQFFAEIEPVPSFLSAPREVIEILAAY